MTLHVVESSMKRIALFIVAISLVFGGLALSAPQTANAMPTVVEDGGGGTDWTCTDATQGKIIYGTGDEGTKWYRCVRKDWTFDDILYSWGHYFWLHNGAWPFYHYVGQSAWEGL